MSIALSARAVSLVPSYADAHALPDSFKLLLAYAAKNPGLDFRNYCASWQDASGRWAYFAESRSITKDLASVRYAARWAVLAGVTDEHIAQACKRAFACRLSIIDGVIDYCTGQYWPTEYRKAIAAVLEEAARIADEQAQQAA